MIARVREDAADEVGAALVRLGASGVERRDATTLDRAPDAGGATLVAGFPDRASARHAAGAIDGPSVRAEVAEIVGDAWRDAYKEHFRPFRLGRRLVVEPPWERARARRGDLVLVMEPGRAFGTGLHATTALAARAIERRVRRIRGGDVLDVGTGSGILALCALRLGARAARAIDTDPDAVRTARENARRNGVGARLRADTTPVGRLRGRWNAVVANIEAGVLGDLAPAIRRRVRPGGLVVLSGILEHRAHELEAAYRPLLPLEATRKDGWVCLVLRAGRSE